MMTCRSSGRGRLRFEAEELIAFVRSLRDLQTRQLSHKIDIQDHPILTYPEDMFAQFIGNWDRPGKIGWVYSRGGGLTRGVRVSIGRSHESRWDLIKAKMAPRHQRVFSELLIEKYRSYEGIHGSCRE